TEVEEKTQARSPTPRPLSTNSMRAGSLSSGESPDDTGQPCRTCGVRWLCLQPDSSEKKAVNTSLLCAFTTQPHRWFQFERLLLSELILNHNVSMQGFESGLGPAWQESKGGRLVAFPLIFLCSCLIGCGTPTKAVSTKTSTRMVRLNDLQCGKTTKAEVL